MTVSDPANPAPRSFAGDLLHAVRYYLRSRVGLVAIAAAALGLGAYYNWGWLAAIGLAPILLSALPCAAMCALGLCMSGRSKSQINEAVPTQNLLDESGGQPTSRLEAPLGAGGTDASDQPASAAPRHRRGCC